MSLRWYFRSVWFKSDVLVQRIKHLKMYIFLAPVLGHFVNLKMFKKLIWTLDQIVKFFVLCFKKRVEQHFKILTEEPGFFFSQKFNKNLQNHRRKILNEQVLKC